MHLYRAPFRELDTFFAVRSWVDCITNMSGFDLRQAQGGNPFDEAEPVTHNRDAEVNPDDVPF
jgi:hypothetical protein